MNDKFLKYCYPLGDAAYNGDWKRYDEIHKKMRKECWSWGERIAFKIGRFVRFIKKI